MSILTNMLQGICAYHIKKKSPPTLPAKSQSDTPSTDIIPLGLTFIKLSANAFSLDQSKILSFGKEIKNCHCVCGKE